ncbi:hypothetical protein GMES_1975 [Paraglaciecola mesophila KMM 241]|uniref:Uncharacterized protein n=2 Tax=Paraglaciecola mesophila TaxID=197222 RepID=K6YJU6_9ALTE|nr:hypothetical protein GMES_1975 [Paraglaciecola mesophila KMM 241]|tara:strand:+ start:1820 stop:2323 length:504 start_codon:yes stop_codon:yes gene_type:complete
MLLSLHTLQIKEVKYMSFNISVFVKGIIAGFVGTLVLTGLMMVKKNMGVMPELDPIHMMSTMAAEKMGTQISLTTGWIMHFVLGSVAWGGAFAVFNGILPGGSQVARGMTFGILAWLLMMIGPMPMSGAGLFGLSMGIMAPVMTLILHLVFGAAMGFTFAKLLGTSD